MKGIEGVSSSAAITSLPSSGAPRVSFQAVVDSMKILPSLTPHPQLVELTEKVARGQTLSMGEMMNFQVRTHELHVRVELTSKAAESALTTLKRFQQQQ